MAVFEKSEFAQWRNSDVHKEFVRFLKEEMEEKASVILNRAYPDGDQDMYIRGAIKAYASALEWEPEFKKDEENDEEA